jgi:ribonuclease P protein component
VLAREHRLTRGSDFSLVFRRGARFKANNLVAHFHIDDNGSHAKRVGFVVSKAVGNAVRRNLVKRRLRALVASHLDQLPEGTMLVIRALPTAATCSFAELGSNIRAVSRRMVAVDGRSSVKAPPRRAVGSQAGRVGQ